MKPILMLIDLQNDFLAVPGLTPAAGEIIHNAAFLLSGCRDRNVPVVHVRTTVTRQPDCRMNHWKKTNKWICVADTPGHLPPSSLLPTGDEKVLHKSGFNPFTDGALDEILAGMQIDTVWVAGLFLHMCVRTAAIEAYERGLKVRIVEDAVGSDDPLHAMVTRRYMIKRTIGFVSVHDLLSGIGPGDADTPTDRSQVQSIPATVTGSGKTEPGKETCLIHESPLGQGRGRWRLPVCKAEVVARTAEAAKSALETWGQVDIDTRAAHLRELAELLKRKSEDIANRIVLEVGKPITDAMAEVAWGAELLWATAGRAGDRLAFPCGPRSSYRYRPVGVVAVITPWNNPLGIPLGKIAPALLYGNSVVWKPSPCASAVASELMDLFHTLEWSAGVVSFVCGDQSTAEALMADERIDAVTITGASSAGYSAIDACTRRNIPLQAELGGNNAVIVWSDSDLAEAARQVVEAAFGYAGQRCTATRRVIVETGCFSRFVELIKEATAALPWGDPGDPKTRVGPLISRNKCIAVEALVARAEASSLKIIVPHRQMMIYDRLMHGHSCYYPPTIVICDDPGHEIVQEETFGPVLVVQRARDWVHALELCNGVRQGLAAALFSNSKYRQDRFLQEARAGILKIGMATAGVDTDAPFGGWKASGIGPCEHGASDREFYTHTQAIYR